MRWRRARRGLGTLVITGCAVLALSGCGSGSQTALEEAEEQYRALDAEVRELSDRSEAKADEFETKSDELVATLERQRDDIVNGDLRSYRARRDEAKALKRETNQLNHETNELWNEAEPLEREQEKVATKIEGLKGCDAQCREARDEAIELSFKCTQKLGRRYPMREVLKFCDEKFPIPREDILKGIVQEK